MATEEKTAKDAFDTDSSQKCASCLVTVSQPVKKIAIKKGRMRKNLCSMLALSEIQAVQEKESKRPPHQNGHKKERKR